MLQQGLEDERWARIVSRAVALIAFIAIWQFLCGSLTGHTSLLPSPASTAAAWWAMCRSGELWRDAGESLIRVCGGFSLAFLCALSLSYVAVVLNRYYAGPKFVLDLLSSIPPIAWTPLTILWFGIGNGPAFFIVFLGAFFPMLGTLYAAILSVDKSWIDAARTFGVCRGSMVREIIFPACIPAIFVAIRIGIGVGWFNVIAAELIGAQSGLGYRLELDRYLLRSDEVVALMLTIGGIGFAMTQGASIIGKALAPWSVDEKSRPKWLKVHRTLRTLLLPSSLSERLRLTESVTNSFPRETHSHNRNGAAFSANTLVVRNLDVSYGNDTSRRRRVLHNISFEIRVGEVVSIVGANGSGKTTLLKSLAGLLPLDQGSITIGVHKVVSPTARIGMLFQNLALFPWLDALGNVAFAAGKVESYQQYKDDYALEQLMAVQLEDYAASYPFELSGGMQQRLAFTRTLVTKPEVILLDEPFSSLDIASRENNQKIILKLTAESEAAVVIVTHDIEEAIFMSDRIMILGLKPATITDVIDIPLQRPRANSVRSSAEFLSTYSQVSQSLHASESRR